MKGYVLEELDEEGNVIATIAVGFRKKTPRRMRRYIDQFPDRIFQIREVEGDEAEPYRRYLG
jgi:hypothetical protein